MAAGAVLGAALRWAALDLAGAGRVEVALLGVNLVGCAVLGAVAAAAAAGRGRAWEPFLGAGLCGALTTWSSLALLAAEDLRDGDWAGGLGWPVAHVVLGVVVAAAAHGGTRRRLAPDAAGPEGRAP